MQNLKKKMKPIKILLVDDESDILEFVSYNLKKENFEVFTASNGLEAIKIAKIEKPNLIILDVMMPEMDGIETCNELRQIDALKKTIIVFLSARSEEFSQLAGYEAGGNDYLTKPIKPKILISKIKALLKLGSGETEDNILKVNNLSIDKNSYLVTYKGKEFNLPKKEFELLAMLASDSERVFKREEILEAIWGSDVVVGGRTIDVHIRKLREKFGDETIITLKGVGYKIKF